MRKWIIIMIMLLAWFTTPAQTAVTNTGILYVGSNADILFAGSDFSNNASSALTNNGQFYIKGNVTNDQAAMATGTGTLYLNGLSAQSVNGLQPFKTFHFNSNNAAGITLNADLSISGVHTFTNGLIATSATPNYIIYEAGSSYTGDADSRHVTGWVKKRGNTNFAFPVGDNTYERTADVINFVSTSELNCHYYTPTFNIFNLAPPLVQVHAGEWWEIDEISGGDVQVMLNWDNAKVAFENVLISEIKVGYYRTGNWRYAGGNATGNIATTGSVTSWAGNSFSVPFTFGFTVDAVLPLKMISFTGERIAGSSMLHWVTENEQGLDRYDVQRSEDGIHFTTIGKVTARNLLTRQEYSFEDHYALQGTAYYRLISVNNNGKLDYSNIIAVSYKVLPANVFLVANPVHEAINIINRSGKEGPFAYKLFNAAGQQILKGNLSMAVNGNASIPLTKSTAAGIYVLEISGEKTLFIQKIVVQQ